jgi:hypothetical protein
MIKTKDVTQELTNFSENNEPLSEWIIEDLFDESNLYDVSYNKIIFKNHKPTI